MEGLNRRGSNRNTITTTGQLTHRISRRINHDLLRVRDRVSLAWEPFGGARGAVGIQFPAFGLWDGSRMTIRIDLASYDRRNGFRGPSLTASRAWDTRLMYGMAVRLRVDVTFRPNWVRLLRRAGIQTAATETAIAAAPVVAGLLWMGFLARTLINASEEGRRQGMATWYAPAYAHSLASRVFDAPSDDALASRDVADYRGVLRTRRAARRDARLRFRSLSRAQVMALRQQHGSVERFRLAVETELCRRMHIPAPRR